MMTTTAMILGMVPEAMFCAQRRMACSDGPRRYWRPDNPTLLTLVVVPVIYTLR